MLPVRLVIYGYENMSNVDTGRKLEDLTIEDFILLLLSGLKHRGRYDGLTGRTMVQKVIYLLTDDKLRDSWGLNYFIHYYGPYSPEVTEASEDLTTFGLVKETPFEISDTTRYDLQITSDGEQQADKLQGSLDRPSKERLAKLVQEADELNAAPLDEVIDKAYAQARTEGLL